LLTAAFHILV